MKSILVTGDWHLSSVGIKTRTGDYEADCKRKLMWLHDVSDKYQVSAVITPGDIFHSNSNSTEFICWLMHFFDSFPCPIYSNIGNHDIEGDNLATLGGRQSGLLPYSKEFRFLSGSCCLFDEDSDFYFYNAYASLPADSDPNIKVVVMHHHLVDMMGDQLVCYPFQLKEVFPNLKTIISGHDHACYKTYVDPNCGITVIRTGSLLRTSSAKENNRIPEVHIVGLEDSGAVVSEDIIPVKPAAPYRDLFSVDVKEIKAHSVSAVSKFVTTLKNKVDVVLDTNGILKEVLDTVTVKSDHDFIADDLVKNGFDIK
jgi:DNA repair exonuclease SbcCD nuclease subunit